MNGTYSFDPAASTRTTRAAPFAYSGKVWNGPGTQGSSLLDCAGTVTGVGFTLTQCWEAGSPRWRELTW